MPVTARLSSRFYEKLGDEATNELVTWLNDFDAEFSERVNALNDRNWDRFRGQLDIRTAELRAEIDSRAAELRTEIRTGLADLRAELVKWMFTFWIVFWIATVVPIAGLILQTK